MRTSIALATALLLSTPIIRAFPLPNFGSDDGAHLSTPADGADKTPPGSSYVILAEDTLHVSVWREPELTATVPVRSDGKISLPLVNDVQAAGLTPMELAASLTLRLKKFVDDPKVTVIVAQMSHPRIYVLGEVLRHGPMLLLPQMTVLQVLATAGLTAFANTKKIYVLRSTDGAEQKLPVNYKRLLKGVGMSQNITLKAGDTVVVP
jgi:polysaccharide export outer membrane protein